MGRIRTVTNGCGGGGGGVDDTTTDGGDGVIVFECGCIFG